MIFIEEQWATLRFFKYFLNTQTNTQSPKHIRVDDRIPIDNPQSGDL